MTTKLTFENAYALDLYKIIAERKRPNIVKEYNEWIKVPKSQRFSITRPVSDILDDVLKYLDYFIEFENTTNHINLSYVLDNIYNFEKEIKKLSPPQRDKYLEKHRSDFIQLLEIKEDIIKELK